jgi:predicted secreted protein
VSITTAVAIYFLIWWITLFAVLPFGVRAPHESDTASEAPGTDPGAPVASRILMKLIMNTVVSGVIFGLCYVVYVNRLVTLDDLVRWLGMPV